METKKLTRRAMLERGAVLSLVVIGAGAGLGACGGGELDCSSPAGLTDAQRQQRQALSYVDRATNPSQRCRTPRACAAAAISARRTSAMASGDVGGST